MRQFQVGETYVAPSPSKPVTGGEGVAFKVVKRTAKYITACPEGGGERRLYIRTRRCAVGEDYEYAWLNEKFGWAVTA